MRSTGSIRSLALVLLFYIATSQGQRRRNCRPGTSCISIRSCPQMIRLIRSGNPSSVRQVRDSICGFSQSNSLVCCPTTGAETTPAPVTPPQLGNSGNLLPEFCGRPSTEDKIIGGTEAKIGAYPWIVALGYSQPGVDNLQFVCSGSIISSRYVLTAAHCVVPSELGGKRLAAIHLGDFDLSTPRDCQRTVIGPKCQAPHIVAGPEQVIVHPQFDKRGKASDDIALIRLNVTLDFEGEANIEPVCLPSASLNVRSFADGREPIAAGWGFTENGSHSSVLLRVKVPLVDDQGCKDLYKEDFVGNQLCVGGVGGRDTCNGDSGGPLILPESNGPPFTQIGLVSFGVFPCGLQSFPGVYSSVADYRNWIIQNLRP